MPNDWHYAVVVGIDQYPDLDQGARDLKCPQADAEAVAEWLTSPDGGALAPDHVQLITRTSPSQPARRPPLPLQEEIYLAVRDSVRSFYTERKKLAPVTAQKEAWEQSRFYFYISGHGLDTSGDDTVVLPANASSDYPAHVSTKGVLNALKRNSVFAEIVVIADACREFVYGVIAAPPLSFEAYAGFNSALGSRTFYAAASRTRKKAYEPPQQSGISHSFLTHALLQGLQGGVVGGRVTSKELSDYLYNDVPTLTAQFLNVVQNPEIAFDPGIVFVTRGVKKHPVRLHIRPSSLFATTAALDAVVYADGGVKARYPLAHTAGDTHEVELEGGSYLIVPRGAEPTTSGIPLHPITVLGLPLDADLP